MTDRKQLLLDLFTEVASVERLCRNYLETLTALDLSPGQFGALNHFIRHNRSRERQAVLAWLFQVPADEMEARIAALEARGYVRRMRDGEDPIVILTSAGRDGHSQALAAMAPAIEPLMSEFRDDDLTRTVHTLQEIRRVFDNLPER